MDGTVKHISSSCKGVGVAALGSLAFMGDPSSPYPLFKEGVIMIMVMVSEYK